MLPLTVKTFNFKIGAADWKNCFVFDDFPASKQVGTKLFEIVLNLFV